MNAARRAIMDHIPTGGCPERLARLEVDRFDPASADPPFDSGRDYDLDRDERPGDDCLQWTHDRLAAVPTALPNEKTPTEDAP